MANYVKFMRGTTAAYDKLTNKDDDTLYFLSDNNGQEGALYLGTKLIAGPDVISGVNSLGELTDVILTPNLDYDALLMYDSVEMKWKDYSFDALTFRAANEVLEGAAGFVPAPKADEHNMFLRGDGKWATISDDKQIFDEIKTSAGQTHESALAQSTIGFILNKGDIAIIYDFIADGKYQYTSYIYNGAKWCAMDGNYNAENVYFSEDLIFTVPVGTIEIPETGSATITAAGKNLKEVLDTVFQKEENPKTKQPILNIHTLENKLYEVGTEIIPVVSYDLDPGSYSFDATSGVHIESITISDSMGRIPDKNAEFEPIIVSDDFNYIISAEAVLSDGIIPHTNLGKEYEAGQIKSKAVLATTAPIVGYRKLFYGATPIKTELTSDSIRNNFTSNIYAYKNGDEFSIDVPKGIYRVIIAYPAELQDLTAVYDRNDGHTNIVNSFKKTIIAVNGYNNYQAIDYKVYTLDFAIAQDINNKFKVII